MDEYLIFWDASALVKRYGPETGSALVDSVFLDVDPTQMRITLWGYAECYSVLHRKYNNGIMDRNAYAEALTSLQQEVLDSGDFQVLSIEDAEVIAGLVYITRYNLNSNDAAILEAYIDYKDSLQPDAPLCYFLAADKRLGQAAQAEGFTWLNPETMSASDLAALLPSPA